MTDPYDQFDEHGGYMPASRSDVSAYRSSTPALTIQLEITEQVAEELLRFFDGLSQRPSIVRTLETELRLALRPPKRR